MGKARTKRKNAQKRKARRVFATIAAELRATEEEQWTPETIEAEQKLNEAERARVHDQWSRAVTASSKAFEKKKRVQEERRQLLRAIRERMASGKAQDDEEGP